MKFKSIFSSSFIRWHIFLFHYYVGSTSQMDNSPINVFRLKKNQVEVMNKLNIQFEKLFKNTKELNLLQVNLLGFHLQGK